MRIQFISTLYFENKSMLNGCLVATLKNDTTDIFAIPEYEFKDEYSKRFSDYG